MLKHNTQKKDTFVNPDDGTSSETCRNDLLEIELLTEDA